MALEGKSCGLPIGRLVKQSTGIGAWQVHIAKQVQAKYARRNNKAYCLGYTCSLAVKSMVVETSTT